MATARGEYNGNQGGGSYRGDMRGQRGDHGYNPRGNPRYNNNHRGYDNRKQGRGRGYENQSYHNQGQGYNNQGQGYNQSQGYDNQGQGYDNQSQGYNQGQGYNNQQGYNNPQGYDHHNNMHDMNTQFQRSMNFNGPNHGGQQNRGNRGSYRGQPRGGQAPRGGQVQEHGHGRKPEYDHGFVSFNKKILTENVFRLLIRERNVKVVLGPKGENIKKLKDMCKGDCKVTIYTQSAHGEPFPEGSVDRVICVETGQDDIEKVLLEMIPHFQTYPPAKMIGKFNEIRLLVPDFTCSSIIGPKGDHVKNIQRDFRSFVQVHKNPAPSSTEHVVSLTNREAGALAMSAAQIYRSIQKIKSISHVTLYNPLVWYPGEFGDTGSFIEGPTLTKPKPDIDHYTKSKSYEGYSEGQGGGYVKQNSANGRYSGGEGFDPSYLSNAESGEGFDPTYLQRGNRGGSRGGGNRGGGVARAGHDQKKVQYRKPFRSTEQEQVPANTGEWFQGPEHNVRDADVSMETLPDRESLPEFASSGSETLPIPDLICNISLPASDSLAGSDNPCTDESQYVTGEETVEDLEDDCPSCGHTDDSPIPRKPRHREPGCKPMALRGFGRNPRGLH